MRYLIGLPLFLFGLCSSSPAETIDDRDPLELIVLSYNIHHAEGNDGRVDIERIARVILDADPDLVALQEVDRFVRRTDGADQARQLAELTGMHMRFGFAINYQGGDFGNVILSRHPIHAYTTYPLPGEPGEDRVLMHAVVLLEAPDGGAPDTVSFMATHLDTFREPREASIPLILDRVPAEAGHLHILAGDLNDLPDSPAIRALQERFILPGAASPLPTHPAANPDRQIDYILYLPAPGWRLDSLWVIPEPLASDHAPLAARFILHR